MNSRRIFIKNTAMAAGAMGIMELIPLDMIASMRKRIGANDKINVGLIGVRGQGFSDLKAMLRMSEVNLIAICDIDRAIE